MTQTFIKKNREGFTVFFTGLPAAGKTTVAQNLLEKLTHRTKSRVILLDGDVVRKKYYPDLGFSKQARETHARWIGHAASKITRNGDIAICALIAPHDGVRKEVRAMVECNGGFILVHVSTPVSVCENRDQKGLYKKARAGAILQFTGVSDTYEEPSDAEIVVDMSQDTPGDATDEIMKYLFDRGLLMSDCKGSLRHKS